VTTREYRIWSGSAITTIGSSGKPFAFIDAEDRGYTFGIRTLTGTALSAVLVGSMGNGVVNSTACGRFMSLLDSSTTNTDGAASTRAILIGRAGGTTPSSSWQVYRNNAQLVAAASSYDTVEQISTIFDGTNVSLRRNNGSPVQQLPRLHSTARASRWASPETARSDRRQGPMWPSGGSSRPPSVRPIETSCMPTRRHSSACRSGNRLVI